MIILQFFVFDQFVIEPLRVLTGLDQSLERVHFVLLILDVLIVTVLGYWLNDFYDQRIDAVNKPDRFLVKYEVKSSQFFSWVLSLLLIGAGITLYLGFTVNKLQWVWLYPLIIALLWMYGLNGKQWGVVGNVLISACIAFIPLLIIIAEQSLISELRQVYPIVYDRLIKLLSLFTLLMLLLNISREIVKDIQDMSGDSLVRSKSIPLLAGANRAKIITIALLAFSASVQWCLFFFLDNSNIIFIYSTLVSLLLLIVAVSLVKSNDSRGFARGSLALKALMIFGLFELMFIPIV